MAEINSAYSVAAQPTGTTPSRFHAGPPPCHFGRPLWRLVAGGLKPLLQDRACSLRRLVCWWNLAAVRTVALKAGAKPKADVKTLQDGGRLAEERYPNIESSV